MIHACILDIHGTDGSSDCVVFTATPEDLEIIKRYIHRANRGGMDEVTRIGAERVLGEEKWQGSSHMG